MTTETLAALEAIRIAPDTNSAKFVWSYAQRNAHPHSRAPVACAAIIADRINDPDTGDEMLIGFGVGFSYCSRTDIPSKARGRHLATTRGLVAIKTVRGHRSRYGQNKTAFDGNDEPYQTGHVMFTYIPASSEEEVVGARTASVFKGLVNLFYGSLNEKPTL
jgi:hypothetical protein